MIGGRVAEEANNSRVAETTNKVTEMTNNSRVAAETASNEPSSLAIIRVSFSRQSRRLITATMSAEST